MAISGGKKRPERSRAGALAIALFLVSLFSGLCPEGAAQSVAEAARAAREKKAESTAKVWTNDDLGSAFPEIKLLGHSLSPPYLSGYEGSPENIVEAMLRLADVVPGEVVMDVGSGDGRIVILAAELFGARGIGIEIDKKWVDRSREAIAAKGLEDSVKILHANALDVDLSVADVVTTYLTAKGLETLRPHLERTLRPGTRVVCHRAEIPGWTPERVMKIDNREIYLYRAP